jgi:hypothetical protein
MKPLPSQLDAGQPQTSPSRPDRRLDALVAFVGLAILALTVAASLAAADPGEKVTRNTMRLAFACYIAALIGMMRLGQPDWLARTSAGRIVRWCWTFANVYFLAHVASAFQFYHHWSHRDAFERTRAISGFGEGLYVSYLFTLVWTADAAWWWLAPQHYARRPKWIGRTLHAFMAFIIFNGTVMFESGATRVAGVIAFAVVLVFWATASGRFHTLRRIDT